MNWLINLPVPSQIALLVAVIAAITSIITALLKDHPKAVVWFICCLFVAGVLSYFFLPKTSVRTRDRISKGDPFNVVLYTRFGDLAAHQVYSAQFHPGTSEMTVTGYSLNSKRMETAKNPCLNLVSNGQFVLWGHPFTFDDYLYVVDREVGRCGILYFPADVPAGKVIEASQ